MLTLTPSERLAATALILLIVLSLSFSAFYEARSSEPADFTEFNEQIAQFEMRQQFLEDSIENARKESYANRYQQNRTAYSGYDSSRNMPFEKQEKKPLYTIVKLELNACDTSEIVVVPQFGSKRAQKLVEYRESLGGFYAFEQLREVYVLQNIDMELLNKYFTLDVSLIRKININTATYNELVAHPYIDAYLAKLMINHRDKKGKFTSIEEVQKATNAYQELIEKLRYYVEF